MTLWLLHSEFANSIFPSVTPISERYTSQTCCACGTIDKSNRKTRGLYVCDCGLSINADRNGANNILQRYLCNRSSGSVALPVVTLVLSRTNEHCLRINSALLRITMQCGLNSRNDSLLS